MKIQGDTQWIIRGEDGAPLTRDDVILIREVFESFQRLSPAVRALLLSHPEAVEAAVVAIEALRLSENPGLLNPDELSNLPCGSLCEKADASVDAAIIALTQAKGGTT